MKKIILVNDDIYYVKSIYVNSNDSYYCELTDGTKKLFKKEQIKKIENEKT